MKFSAVKYKEIPIDDTKGPDQFKVGDRVRVYGGIRDRGEVVKSDGIALLNIRFDSQNADWAYWKQCRKLEPVEPREIWIHPDAIDTTKEMGLYNAQISHKQPIKKTSWIKMREVLEAE